MPIVGKAIESSQIPFGTGSATDVTLRTGIVSTPASTIIVATNADCYIHFDSVADNTCFVLQSGCPFQFDAFKFNTISVMGVNSSGTLYFIAQRN